jgi:hypothetical protein
MERSGAIYATTDTTGSVAEWTEKSHLRTGEAGGRTIEMNMTNTAEMNTGSNDEKKGRKRTRTTKSSQPIDQRDPKRARLSLPQPTV